MTDGVGVTGAGKVEDGSFPGGKWGFVPRSEVERRIARFQAGLKRAGIDLSLIIQNADLYYLSGTIQQGQLLVPAGGEPVLLVRKDPERARAESAITDIRPVGSLRELPGAVSALGIGAGAVIGMELDVMPVSLFRRYQGLFRGAEIRDCSPIIRQVRSVKSAYEQALISEAAQIVDRGFRAATEALRPGMTELELSAVCEAAMREVGNSNVRVRAFNEDWPFGNVSAGPSAALAGYTGNPLAGAGVSPAIGQGSGWRPIGRGEPVVLDLVGFAGGISPTR
jgi:Xaa-Pro dipeptidase